MNGNKPALHRREFLAVTAAGAAALLTEGCALTNNLSTHQPESKQGETGMLKGISPVISPELIKIMMEMGHGDELVIADGNFPAATCAQRLVRADGHGCCDLLEAVLKLFPLDIYVEKPVAIMQVVPGDNAKPTIWNDFRKILQASGEKFTDFDSVERFAFYERAKKAFAIVATSEGAIYANIILKKGLVRP